MSVCLDRFSQGLPDPQEKDHDEATGAIGYCHRCGLKVYKGNGVMLDDELYCDTYCLAKAMGAIFV